MHLLFTDTHWDDQPVNEYRWLVFDAIRQVKTQYPISMVFLLGDAVDRKDNSSGAFINRLLNELKSVAPIIILRGNHDTNLHPPPYFSFLSTEFLKHSIEYISEPTEFADSLLLLPFTSYPKEDWKDLGLTKYKSVFMHQTITGAVTENGQVMESRSFPILPGRVKFYSGDIHVPQQIRNVTYVGCPHPIKFGDKYPCRMLMLDEETYEIVGEIPLSPPRKLMLDIRSIEDLAAYGPRPGDQVKIRLTVQPDAVDGFGEDEAAIAAWAKQNGVTIAGTEVIVNTGFDRDVDINQTPEAILRSFADSEGLTSELLQVGLDLLNE